MINHALIKKWFEYLNFVYIIGDVEEGEAEIGCYVKVGVDEVVAEAVYVAVVSHPEEKVKGYEPDIHVIIQEHCQNLV